MDRWNTGQGLGAKGMIDIVEKAENMRSWTKLELELIQEVKRLREIEQEWKQMWSKLEDYPVVCAMVTQFVESGEE